jgi:hypothetical protein
MRLLLGEAETEVVDGDEGADTTEQ